LTEQETEFKYQLTPTAHLNLTELLGSPRKERRFTNRYYTVANNNRRDWVLRLRVEDQSKELTLKIGRVLSSGIYDSVEYSEFVNSAEPTEWNDTEPIRTLNREISEEPVELQGEARNQRLVFDAPLPVGREWEVDRCELPDGEVFYELEVEVHTNALPEISVLREKLEHWLKERGIPIQPSQTTKYRRFLASLPGGP
jgi:adenylate cyclase class IV